jgi:hypothetical protein
LCWILLLLFILKSAHGCKTHTLVGYPEVSRLSQHGIDRHRADVRELPATCDLADRPDAGRGGLQPLVDLDVSPVSEFNAGQFQAD